MPATSTDVLLPVLFLDVDGTIATLVDPASDYSDRRASWVAD